MIPEYNQLLRSAYQIAKRKGADTNWEAFEKSLEKELLLEAGLSDETIDEQPILRATCTARPYKSYPTE